MNHWWRAYNEAVNDPKLQLISDSLFRVWFNLMCIASGNEGQLPALASIAFTLRMKPEKVAQVLAQLCTHGLLDKTETGFEPHNWKGRQYKSDTVDETAAQRMQRYRLRNRNNRNETVTVTPPREQIQSQITETDSVAKATGADAPIDPSIAERDFFTRGKEVLGKSSGGQLAKLKTSRGGNVALSRAVIETAATKQNPSEYVAAVIRGPPERPLTEFQKGRQELKGILNDLGNFATGSGQGSGENPRLLSGNSSERSAGLRSGFSTDVIDLPEGSYRSSG